jgi:PiT family inorganic phosphate transporter
MGAEKNNRAFMNNTLLFIVLLTTFALISEYVSNYREGGEAIAPIIMSRVISPGTAVIWAAFFNFIPILLIPFSWGTLITKTIGSLIHLERISAENRLYVLFAALLGVIICNLITWFWDVLPLLSTYVFIGSYAGAAIAAHRGVSGLLEVNDLLRIAMFALLSPLMGIVLGASLMASIYWLYRRWAPHRIDRTFRRLELFSSACFFIEYGNANAQRTMAIIMAALTAGSILPYGPKGTLPEIPLWVALVAYSAVSLGMLSGGVRTRRPFNSRITKLRPVTGFCSETGAAIPMLGVLLIGIPVSPTYILTGSIIGAGSMKRLSAINWGVIGRIIWALILIPPSAALIAASCFFMLQLIRYIGAL